MATLAICSKSDVLRLTKNTWHCMTELDSDVLIEVEDFSFLLHKFPLINASPVLAKTISKFSIDEDRDCAFALDIPGGAQSFELIAKFCYGEKIELTSSNAVPLLCAARDLDMNEECMRGNLISQIESFLSSKILTSWEETIVALLSSESIRNHAEELGIVARCLDSLACKVTCGKTSHPQNEISWSGMVCMKETNEESGSSLAWWHDDICALNLHLFKRFMEVLNAKQHDPVDISRAVIHYAHSYKVDPNSTGDWSESEKILLEEIVELLPKQKGATSVDVLLKMLSTGITLNANENCIQTLEKRVGAQLDEASAEDLLVLNSHHGGDKAVSNVDCIKRLIKQFTKENSHENESVTENCTQESDKFVTVAKLVDDYLAKIAKEEKLELQQFISLASAVPNGARPCGDDLYHAISAYLEYHPQLSDEQKEQICQLIDVQKLSQDLCREVAKNENLPLRVIVKAMFCEMLDLKRTLSDYEELGNNTGTEAGTTEAGTTEAGNTTDDDTESGEVKEVITKSKGTLSRIFYRERIWYRLRWTKRGSGSPMETKETDNQKAQGENVMCHFLKNTSNIWSYQRVKALLATAKQ